MKAEVEESFNKLKHYCEHSQFKGWDPYDGLNSEVFSKLYGLRNSRFFKLCWIQFFKRSPVNLRKILLVKKDYNAKGLALFLIGHCKLYKISPTKELENTIYFFVNKLLELQNLNYSGPSWGYNFDWQARAFFQPKNTPTVVATSFIIDALIEAYQIFKIEKLLPVIKNSARFVLEDLNRIPKGRTFGLSYSPLDRVCVFNASLLGAKLLSKVATLTKSDDLLEEAQKIVQFCVDHQNPDGSWSYGTEKFHYWIDNFHTAYNLECINEFQKQAQINIFDKSIEKGMNYYVHNFFLDNGIPKYYNNSTFPIDIHAPAQLVVMMSKLGKFHQYKELIDRTLKWTIENMQSSEGYFYYQKNKYFNSKIPYMRWSQAWMFYALSYYLRETTPSLNCTGVPNNE